MKIRLGLFLGFCFVLAPLLLPFYVSRPRADAQERPAPTVTQTKQKAADFAHPAPQTPSPSRATDKPAADVNPSPPLVPDDAKRVLTDLQLQAAGLTRAMAVLQKELDSVTAEWTRAVTRLQTTAPAGYELTPQLTYAKKPVPPKATGKQDEDRRK